MSSPTDAPSREELIEICCRAGYGKKWDDTTEGPGEAMKNVWLKHIAKFSEPLLARLSEVEKALEHIANHPHCSYEEGPFISQHDSGYKMGIAEGHRCAAVSARAVLQHKEPQG